MRSVRKIYLRSLIYKISYQCMEEAKLPPCFFNVKIDHKVTSNVLS